MNYTNQLVISSTEQTIDINRSIINFKAQLEIRAKEPNETFQLVVIPKSKLENKEYYSNFKNS